MEPGSYIVREGTRQNASDPVTLTLFVRAADNIQRFKIEVKTELTSTFEATTHNGEDSNTLDANNAKLVDFYLMGGRKFASVDLLISRYKSEEILDNLFLSHPVSPLVCQISTKYISKISSGFF